MKYQDDEHHECLSSSLSVRLRRARVQFIQHKRYQMSDIAKIEMRVKDLEYYTSLNILESNSESICT